ncbi:DNA glycosylase [Mycena sanguinolenta]|nr:DNA glycosylase [Mycena sanguinolenta]
MGKRKFSDSEAEFLDVDVSDSDDQFDAPSGSKTRRKSTSSGQASKKRTKHDFDGANDVSGASPSTHAKSVHVLGTADISSIRTALLQWYSTVHALRQMPWRKKFDSKAADREQRGQRAYEVWISEIMLQQTQVATVIPYYNRWLEKFPTIRDLAASSIDEVNSLWKGLGYYSRASRLLAGAKKSVTDYGGRLPDNAKDMQANIPGIGRYSAGAICSIAYGENAPVLDGNVNRLLSRFLALHAPPKAKATLDILWNAASAMVQDLDSSSECPGDVNQALIELGSTVCKVRDPGCASCPIRTWCSAYTATQLNGSVTPLTDIEDLCQICEPLADDTGVTAYPMKANKKKAREELDIVNVVEWRSGSDRQFVLVRRPEGGWLCLFCFSAMDPNIRLSGLLAGLDEFPTSPNVPASLSRASQLKVPQEILSNLLHHGIPVAQKSAPDKSGSSLRITKVQPAGDVVHLFSHIKKVYRINWVILEGTSEPPRLASVTPMDKNLPAFRSKGKGKSRKDTNNSDVIPCSTWVPLNVVSTKNMSTGSMKVWNLCRTLWEAEQ